MTEVTEFVYKRTPEGLVLDPITVIETPPRKEVHEVDEVKFLNQNPDSIGPPRENPRSYVGMQASDQMPLGNTYTLQLPTGQGGAGEVLENDGTGQLEWAPGGAGDVIYTGVEPVPTPNQFAIYDNVEGKKIKDSGITSPVPGSGVAGDVLTLTTPTDSVWAPPPGAAGVSGVPPTTIGNLAEWSDATATQISNSAVVASQVVQNPSGLGPNGNLAQFGATPEQITDSGLPVADIGDVKSNSIPANDKRIALYDGVSGVQIRESTIELDDSSAADTRWRSSFGTSLFAPGTSFQNCLFGQGAGGSLVPGGSVFQNTAVGVSALNAAIALNTNSNTAIGHTALTACAGGSSNTSVGALSSFTLTTGSGNTAMGRQALQNLTTGSGNLCFGNQAGQGYVGGESDNILIGRLLSGTPGESNVIRIGNGQNDCFIDGIVGNSSTPTYENVMINPADGQLATSGVGVGDVTSSTIPSVNNTAVVYDGVSGTQIKAAGVITMNGNEIATTVPGLPAELILSSGTGAGGFGAMQLKYTTAIAPVGALAYVGIVTGGPDTDKLMKIPLPDEPSFGQMYFNGNTGTQTPVFAVNTWYPVAGPGGYSSTPSPDFTYTTVGNVSTMTYTGTGPGGVPDTIRVSCGAAFCWESASGTSDDATIAIHINTGGGYVPIQASIQNSKLDNNNFGYPRNGSCRAIFTMTTGNSLQMRVQNNNNTANILVLSLSFDCFEINP